MIEKSIFSSLIFAALLSVTALSLAGDSADSLPGPGGNRKVKSFSQAKKILPKIHAQQNFTLYCHCKYRDKKVDLASCGYKPRKVNAQASRLEWEHVVPAEAFGQSFVEWREGSEKCTKGKKRYKGRKCAGKNSEFARMEADLYNLWPEIGELNRLRSNFSMAALGGPGRNPASKSFGGCKAVLGDRKFEPSDEAKGIVARTYMYMHQAYPGRGIISDKNEKLFEAWDKQFPVSAWECDRGQKIAQEQGNHNPILKSRCEAKAKG